MTTHVWTQGVRNSQPLLTCTNEGCQIVWWPDRREPRSACQGREPERVGGFSADDLEQIFHAAVKAGDARAVEAALTVLCGLDPQRAVRLHDDLKFALRVAEVLSP